MHRTKNMPSKRYNNAARQVDAKKAYPLKAAVEILNKFPKAKFNETIDLAFRLGVDPKQSDQMVRGTVPLPHGSGKTVRGRELAVTDGPFTEAKDIVLGFIIVLARDLDHAVEIAKTSPLAQGGGGIEIRPVMEGGAP